MQRRDLKAKIVAAIMGKSMNATACIYLGILFAQHGNIAAWHELGSAFCCSGLNEKNTVGRKDLSRKRVAQMKVAAESGGLTETTGPATEITEA